VVCLDSGCGNYEQLWCTTSLRGNLVGKLNVEILKEGVHSGGASGVVPSSFRILRQLLSRIEDEETGRILVPELHCEIPTDRLEQSRRAAAILGAEIHSEFAFVPGAGPMGNDPVELLLNKTWRPTLSVTGMDGIPSTRDGGNVLRPRTCAKLSFRLPPTVDGEVAMKALRKVLTSDPPYGAKVTFEGEPGAGWNAPPLAAWLQESVSRASRTFFDRDVAFIGEGGTIPFMGMLGRQFPQAQFLITGVLGPGSNAHGPNEFLEIAMGKKLTCCVTQVLADHAVR
jgi:acetylornithine deacetylase/succinyl-diaminopimelate desuccinylase-like protein